MAKISKEEMLRRQGFKRAYEIAKTEGIEGLEREVKLRGVLNSLPIRVTQTELEMANEEIVANTLSLYLALVFKTLHDHFGFGTKRINDFHNYFNEEAEVVTNDVLTWDDVVEDIFYDCGVEINDIPIKTHRRKDGE